MAHLESQVNLTCMSLACWMKLEYRGNMHTLHQGCTTSSVHNKVCTQRRKTKKDKLIPENRMFFYFQTGMKCLKRILVCQRVTKVILRELRVINYRRRIIYIRAHTHTIMCTQILAMTEETLRMVILERLQTIRTPELNETNRWSEIKSFTKCIKKFPTSFSNCT